MKYFKIEEFDQPRLIGSGANMNAMFLEKLDKARELAEIPFAVVRGGGWRSEDYQREIYRKMGLPPVLNSFHLKGRAADIAYKSENDLYKIINAAWESGLRGFGINRGAIHLDDRDSNTPVVWGYSKTKNTPLYQEAKKYIESLPEFGTKARLPKKASYALPLILATSLLVLWKL